MALKLVDAYVTFDKIKDILERTNMEPHYVKAVINECVVKKFYDINIETRVGNKGSLYELAKEIE